MERTDCPGGRKEEAYSEEHPEWLGFPYLLHSEKEHAGSPCKGARPEIELLVPAWARAG